MKIVMVGGTGFIGRHLVPELLKKGHAVVVLSRSPEKDRKQLSPKARLVQWDGKKAGEWVQEIDGADAVINLAGKNIFTYWSETAKKQILGSRIHTVRLLHTAMEQAHRRPTVFISASAVGYYGNRGDTVINEQTPAGHDFLAEVCAAWEEEAQKVCALGVRVVNPRFGIVLEKDGGALRQLMIPFRFFVGGWLGSGQQWFSWVHMDDLIEGISHILHHESTGAYNICAPHPLRLKEFTAILGKILGRPSWIPVPKFVLTLILGEVACMVLDSQRVLPERLVAEGYLFRFPTAQSALEQILK